MLFIQSEAREKFRNFAKGSSQKWRDVPCASVNSFSSHTSEAGVLKIGMHNPYMDCSKVTHQIFDSLPRS